jgi:PAS domain S-box-containing protein
VINAYPIETASAAAAAAADDDARESASQRKRWLLVALAALAMTAWLVLRPGGDKPAAWVGVIGNILGPILGTVWWLTAPAGTADPRRRDRVLRLPRGSTAWLLLGASILAFLVGQLVFYYYDRILGESPFPTAADVFFVAAYPRQAAAVLLLPGVRGSGLRVTRVLLDSLMTVTAVATFSWFFLVGPLLMQPSALSPLGKVLAAGYPVMDLAVLFCLVLLHASGRAGGGRGDAHRPAVYALSLGMIVLVVGDTVYAAQNLHGTYRTGTLNDITWPLAYMLLGLGARGLRGTPARARELAPVEAPAGPGSALTAAFWHSLLPYVLIPAVLFLYGYVDNDGAGAAAAAAERGPDAASKALQAGIAIGAAVILALMFARQVVALAEKAALNRRLHDALRGLEASNRTLAMAHGTLRRSEERFRIAAQSSGELIYEWHIDTGVLEWFGDIDAQLGYVQGGLPRRIEAWEQIIHEQDRPGVVKALARHLEHGEAFEVEYRVVTRDRRVLTWFDRGTAIRDAAGRAVRMVGAIGDVTARKATEQRIRHESLHDALTGLPNRVLFCDRVERCIQRARRAGTAAAGGTGTPYHFAVLFLDLDRFKVINDSLGHAAGDGLLVEMAERLQTCLRQSDSVARDPAASPGPVPLQNEHDSVARLGGDEFTILLDDLADPGDAERVAERIQAELSRPVYFESHELFSSASIGVVHGSAAYASAKDLLRDADAAMYRAKTGGKARHAVFDSTMHAAAVARLRLESELRRALERRELVLQYQPIVSLTDGTTRGFEALLRWRREGRLVSPAEFIPVAEDTGLIVPIGAWVLAEACRQLAQWGHTHGAPAAALSVSVNLSRKQLADAGIVEHCRRALADHGLDASRLKLEITESVIMENGKATGEAVRALRELGVGLQIDDFGTGYSSLSCIHDFPLDCLKIDRSFATHAVDRDRAAVLNAIVHLAHNLGMGVVAEGIETADQLTMLQGLDCDFGQGYLFAPPLDADVAVEFIGNAATRRSRLSA